MAEEERKTNITWTASDGYLNDFMAYFMQAQASIPLCRMNRDYLWDFFHNLSQLWMMEAGYCSESEVKLHGKEHDEIEALVNNYSKQSDTYKKNNFDRIFKRANKFFFILNVLAVNKNFFPRKGVERTIGDKLDSLRQK